MIDMGIVHGSKEMAVPVYMGFDTVYVHTNIEQDMTPDPVTCKPNPNMYVYHEVQYDYKEYFQIADEQRRKDTQNLENVICENDMLYSAEMANLENAMCEADAGKENV